MTLSSLASSLDRFQARRKFANWQPKPTHARYYGIPGNEDVLHRLLSFIDLEVTVGEWITAAKHKLPSDCASYIDRNSKDESKHDEALRFLYSYIGTPVNDPQSTALIKEWQAQPPSFALAYALEMGIFMSILPWLTRHGDIYCAQVSQWISDDEVVHVLTNRLLAEELGECVSSDLCSLVARTLYFIFEPTGHQNAVDEVKRAIRRISTGSDPASLEQSLPVITAFFETNNRQAILY